MFFNIDLNIQKSVNIYISIPENVKIYKVVIHWDQNVLHFLKRKLK